MRKTAFYVIVHYCPCLGRREAANVGVLLFCPETGEFGVKITDSVDRICRFFPAEANEFRLGYFLRAAKNMLEEAGPRFKTPEDVKQYSGMRGPPLRLSEAREAYLYDDESFSDRLENMFAKFVEEPPLR